MVGALHHLTTKNAYTSKETFWVLINLMEYLRILKTLAGLTVAK